jgi:hypothetical protein
VSEVVFGVDYRRSGSVFELPSKSGFRNFPRGGAGELSLFPRVKHDCSCPESRLLGHLCRDSSIKRATTPEMAFDQGNWPKPQGAHLQWVNPIGAFLTLEQLFDAGSRTRNLENRLHPYLRLPSRFCLRSSE